MSSDEGGPLQGMAAEYRLRLPEHGAAVLDDPRLRNTFGDACHPMALMLASTRRPCARRAAGSRSADQPVPTLVVDQSVRRDNDEDGD